VRQVYALDTETGPYPMPEGVKGAFALEPYRKEFYMKLFGLYGAGVSIAADAINRRDKIIEAITKLRGEIVYCHNTIFDIAVLMRYLGPDHYELLASIRWRDTSLLAKWVNNSQSSEHFRYSLRNCVDKWLPDSAEKTEFLELKDNIEDDYNYWLERVVADCKLTQELALVLEDLLPETSRQGFITECRCLWPLAKGWKQGILVNPDKVDELAIIYRVRANKLLKEIGLDEATLRSPKKLRAVLFEEWGQEPVSFTAKGEPSTCAGDIKYIALNSKDDRLLKLLEAKQHLTVISKYANSYEKAMLYLGEPKIHPSPKLFNSYTGRMTYNSKLFKKHQVGIALHQQPRKAKEVKRCMEAPQGYKFIYMDFAAQELRIMAQMSNDEAMINAFNDNKDLHAVMTESIYATPYDEIVAGNKSGDKRIMDERNCGKLTNLSSMYRIGAKALKAKFFIGYDTMITLREATHFLNSYKKSFKCIPKYWESIIRAAKRQGYVESLSGRRFYLKANDWQGESSAINMPIQGSGADLSELLIALLDTKFPELIFQVQVHDSLVWLIPDELNSLELKEFVDSIDYNKYFEADLKVDFPLDFALGTNLMEMSPLA